MKKFKIVLWAVLIGFLLLLIFQNQDYFQSRHQLGINLLLIDTVAFPEVSNAVIFLFCFLIGGLIVYGYNLLERFRSKKEIRELNGTIKSYSETIAALKGELAMATGTSEEQKPDTPDTVRDIAD